MPAEASGEVGSLESADEGIEYRLDRSDRIIAVNRRWSEFASANGARELAGQAVIGRPLRSFVSGDVTRMFVDTLLQAVRLTGREKSVAYRCDSPDRKRYMAMRLRPEAGGEIVSSHQVLREERMHGPLAFVVADGAPVPRVRRCSMCNRVARPGGMLTEPDLARAAGWFDSGQPVRVVYFVCADCQNRIAGNRRTGS